MRLDFGILEGYKRRAFYVLVWSFATMILIGLVADITQQPFIFPSLGPTALMLFAHPLRRDSAPRHVIFGHGIGALSGYFALWAAGLLGVAFGFGIGPRRVFAAAVALALTSAFTVLLRSEHAPAGATTLIVALGILPRTIDFVYLMAAVVLLVVLGLLINRVCGLQYPLWDAPHWVSAHDRELLRKIRRRTSLGTAFRRRV